MPKYFNPYNEKDCLKEAPTQTGNCGSSTSSSAILVCEKVTVDKHMYDLRIRKLTPKECWRLMGFDDECFEKAQKVNSNAQLYKQAGNSIVVNVLYYILKSLLVEPDKPKYEQLSFL